MAELQVPTLRFDVEIVTGGGDQLAGAFIAPDYPYAASPPGQMRHLLNDERVFLPFFPAGRNEAVILHKNHLSVVRLEGICAEPLADAEANPDWEYDESEAHTIWLRNGSKIRGCIVAETPWQSSRLLDKLNHTECFVPVVSENELFFVNRDCVARAE